MLEKVKSFVKKYKNILLMALISLLLILLITTLVNYFGIKSEVKNTNTVQLERMANKATDIEEYTGTAEKVYNSMFGRELEIVAKIIKLEPDDIYNNAFLQKNIDCLNCTENLIILDSNRNVLNYVGDVADIDYNNSYYDMLFAAEDGKSVEIYNEGSKTEWTTAVRCGNLFILSQSNEDKIRSVGLAEEQKWKVVNKMVGLDTKSLFAAVSASDGTVIYTNCEAIQKQKILKEDIKNGKYKNKDTTYYVQYYDEKDGVLLLALTPKSVVIGKCRANINLVSVLFIIVVILMVSYIVCLRQGETDPKDEYEYFGKYFLHTQTARFKALSLLVIFIISSVYLVLSNLNSNRFEIEYLKGEAENVSAAINEIEEASKSLNNVKDNTMYNNGRIVDTFLQLHPEYLNKACMEQLAAAIDVEYVTVFNSEGNTVCTSSSMDHINIYEDTESTLYELRYALMGKEGVCVSGDPKKMSKTDIIYAVPRRGSDSIANGIVAISTVGGKSNFMNEANGLEYDNIIKCEKSENCSQNFITNSKGVVTNANFAKDIEVGSKVEGNVLKNGYCGRAKVGDDEYLVSVVHDKATDNYCYVAIRVVWFSSSQIIRLAVLVLLFIILAIWMWYDGLGSKHHFQLRERKIKDADDWERTELNWDELSISAKMGKIIRVGINILGIMIVIVKILLMRGRINSVGVAYIVSGEWPKTLNGYSVLGNLCVIIVFITFIDLIEYMLGKAEKIVGEEGATLLRLLISASKYIGGVICAYIVVTNFGVDAAAALASIGIVGFALTFGAQELIKDMIAGMFLIFEGKFKVGDMIDYNGEWFWIRSIGVRTTTVEAWGQVRVINNSSMTGMTNISNASSAVNVDIMIDNKYDIEYVKGIIMAELPNLKEKFNADVATPSFKGVQHVSAAGTVIRMRSYCPPMSQGRVGRMMRQEVKHILDANGIEMANDAITIVEAGQAQK